MGSVKKKAPMLVGLCGRSGSGKGYVSEKFAEIGIPSIDTDAVYRKLTAPADEMSPCMKELVEKFGAEVAKDDNSLDRAKMRSLVFGNDRGALDELNRITHKYILFETEKIAAELQDNGNDIVLIDAPVLYESGFDRSCAAVIAVTAPEEKIIERIMRRDGVTSEDAKARLSTQKPVSELTDRADFVIVNDGDDDRLDEVIRECADTLRKMQKEKNSKEKQR